MIYTHYNPLSSGYHNPSSAKLDLTSGRLRISRKQLEEQGFTSAIQRGMTEIETDPFVFIEKHGLRNQKKLSYSQMHYLRMAMPAIDSAINFIRNRMVSYNYRIVREDGQRHNNFSEKRAKRVTEKLRGPNQFGETYLMLMLMYLNDILERDLGTLELATNMAGGIDQWAVIDSFKMRPNPEHVNGDLATAAYFETDAMDEEDIVNRYREDQVIWSNLNPRSGSFYGQSPIEVLDKIILMSIYADRHNIKIVHPNSEKGGGIVWLGGVGGSVRKEFEERYQDFRQNDPGRPVFTAGGDNAPQFLSLDDGNRLEWTELQQSLGEIAASVYQLQPRDIGLAGKHGAAGTAAIEDAITLQSAIIPRLLVLQDILTVGFVHPEGGDDLKLEYIVSKEESLEARTRMASMAIGRGVINIDEYRKIIDETLEPLENGQGQHYFITAGNSVYRLQDVIDGKLLPVDDPEKPEEDGNDDDAFKRTSSKEKQGGDGQEWN